MLKKKRSLDRIIYSRVVSSFVFFHMRSDLLALRVFLTGLCGIACLWVYLLHSSPPAFFLGVDRDIFVEPLVQKDDELLIINDTLVSCHSLRDLHPPRLVADRPDLYQWEREETRYLDIFLRSRRQRPSPVRKKHPGHSINILLYTNHFHQTWKSFSRLILDQLSQTCGPTGGFNFTCGVSHQTTSDSSLLGHTKQAYYANTDILLFVGMDLSIQDQHLLNATVWTTTDRPAVALLTLESSHNSRANAYFQPWPSPHPLQYTDILVTYSRDAHHSVPINYFYGLVEDCPGVRAGNREVLARALRYPIATCISAHKRRPDVSDPVEILSAIFISNCVGWRIQLLRDLYDLGMRFHSYGLCLPEWRNPNGGHFLGSSASDKIAISSQYKFVFAIENNLATDYVTEKFFQTFLISSLPVYIGAFNAHQYAPAPHSFITFSDFETPVAFADYLYEVNHNATLYESYFQWRMPENLEQLIHEERRVVEKNDIFFPDRCVDEASPLSPWFALAGENFIRDDQSSFFCRLCQYQAREIQKQRE